MNLINELKATYKTGPMITKLLIINIGIFVAINLVKFVFYAFNSPSYDEFLHWLAVPASLLSLITRPWTLVSYMFLHEDIFHILFNMLWLYWFGQIFLQYLSGKQMLAVYLLGGLSGAVLYILAFNLLPVFQSALHLSYALGASASVLAIVIAITVYVPNYTISLLFLGPVQIKYIAMVAIAMDLVSLVSANAGGHIAHLGGTVFGFVFASQYRKRNDITAGFSQGLDRFFALFTTSKTKPKMKVAYRQPGPPPPRDDKEYNREKKVTQKEIDQILDKISKTGYDSLSREEKDTLFKVSQQK